VLDGKKYITENLAMALAAEVCRKNGLPHELLSRRELELLKLLAHGKSQKEAAEDMGLNIKTVSTYHVRLLQKMKLNTDVDLTRYALRHNLVLLT
jgi:DNA-binding NarL/FixJ family response regulator